MPPKNDAMKQGTLLGFFSKPSPSQSSSNAPPSSSVRTPAIKTNASSSAAPTPSASSSVARPTPTTNGSSKIKSAANKVRMANPPTSSHLTPPATSEGDASSDGGSSIGQPMLLDSDSEMSEGPVARPAKNKKRKSVIMDDEESDSEKPPAKKAPSKPLKKTKAKSADEDDFSMSEAKSVEADSDDFGFDDDIDLDQVDEEAARTESVKAKAKAKPATNGKAAASKPKATPARSWSNKADERADLVKKKKDVNAETFDFLRDIRDADKNPIGHPDYDPRTLYIPQGTFNKLTPFEKQFWEIKRNHFDTVLFFQKGKFYELYEDDASIGNQEFDLKMTDRVKMRMAGVPEASIDLWISKFLAKGYKVGRVDQQETAIGAEIRQKDNKGSATASAKDKIVQRELRQILTSGTIVDGNLLPDELSSHCIAIKEFTASPAEDPKFGVVVADCSTAEFKMSAFQDDIGRTTLETLIRQHQPREIIAQRNNLSAPSMRLIRSCIAARCEITYLKKEVEFLNASDARIEVDKLFGAKSDSDQMDDDDATSGVPECVRDMYDNDEAMSALGGMLFYLRQLNLDRDLLTVKNFNIFDPIRESKSLILDGQTLAHVEVLQNSLGTDEGTLIKLLTRCGTPFGKRLFKIWVCQPLRDAQAINDRLDAVDDLLRDQDFEKTFATATKGVPDLERLLSRIHAKSCRGKEFLKVLSSFRKIGASFEKLADIAGTFHKSNGLLRLVKSAPDLEPLISNVEAMYDAEDDELLPVEGADEVYDAINEKVTTIEGELQDLLEGYRKKFKDTKICFKDIGTKDIFQVELPTKHKVPGDWTKKSSTKAVNRYYSPEVEKQVRKLKEARERKAQAAKQFHHRVLEEFDKDYPTWLKAVKTVAEIDCLISLAKSSAALGEPACRPEIVEAPYALVDFEELRHPCVFSTTTDFIPNTIQLGGEHEAMVLLTGPNMAGKSTLLRMACIGVIMAQIGCYVPAKRARIAPCDRICSRMGANDNMAAGASTFKVEMDDTRKILTESTRKSLVILDELGRGTSTFDGLSIAYSVLHTLAGHTGCIGYFATHFTSLVDDFAKHPQIALKHMKAEVDQETNEVTFLYRLTNGSSPRSYGPQIAKLAGVPDSIVQRAIAISAQSEEATKKREEAMRKHETIPLSIQADAAYLLRCATQTRPSGDAGQLLRAMEIIRKTVGALEI